MYSFLAFVCLLCRAATGLFLVEKKHNVMDGTCSSVCAKLRARVSPPIDPTVLLGVAWRTLQQVVGERTLKGGEVQKGEQGQRIRQRLHSEGMSYKSDLVSAIS